jgi:hypothetical protein
MACTESTFASGVASMAIKQGWAARFSHASMNTPRSNRPRLVSAVRFKAGLFKTLIYPLKFTI